jgi:cell division protease FtsH
MKFMPLDSTPLPSSSHNPAQTNPAQVNLDQLFAEKPTGTTPPTPDRTKAQKARRNPSGDDAQGEENSAGRGNTHWLLIIALLVLIGIFSTSSMGATGQLVTLDVFLNQLEQKNVKSVTFYENKTDQHISGEWIDPKLVPVKDKVETQAKFTTVFDPRLDNGMILSKIREAGVREYKIEDIAVSPFMNFMYGMLGILIISGIFLFMMRRNSDPMGTGGSFSSFIRSPARQYKPSEQQVTYANVAGMDQVKRELQEIVEFMKDPERFHKLGAQIPKGVLLMGPPGTGKTLLAKATAGEANVPFFSANGSEFIQMFVGVGASRVRDLFRMAKDFAPCIIFIDEIDAVGRVRGAGMGGGHDEREQTLNQILSEMDGFQSNDTVIVLAATNRPDVLDKALTRPGRFDRHITVDLPSRDGRVDILKVHVAKVPLADDVDFQVIAGNTIGFAGADLKNLVNEAALNAARHNHKVVMANDFDEALDRIQLGLSREEKLTKKEKRITAYHETGHALLAWIQPELDPVHKITIVPRGRALGVTQLRPLEERLSIGERRLKAQLIMMLGGRSAEKLIFNEYTAGAQDDLKRATDIARRMVAYWGMSETVGPVAFHHAHDDPFMGRDYQEQRDFSDLTANLIDKEIQKILFTAGKEAYRLLDENRTLVDALTDELLEKEELFQVDIERILGPRPPRGEDTPVIEPTTEA